MTPNVGIRINELNQFFTDPPYSNDLKNQVLDNIKELLTIIDLNKLDNKAGSLTSFIANMRDTIKPQTDLSEVMRNSKTISKVLTDYFNHS